MGGKNNLKHGKNIKRKGAVPANNNKTGDSAQKKRKFGESKIGSPKTRSSQVATRTKGKQNEIVSKKQKSSTNKGIKDINNDVNNNAQLSTDQQRSILIPGNEELQIQKSLRLRDGFVPRQPEVMNSEPGCSHEVMDPGDHGNNKQTRGSKGGNIVTKATETFPNIPAIADKQVGRDTVFVDVNASEDDFYSDSNDDDCSLDGTDANSSDESEGSEGELIDEVGDIPTHQQ